MSPALLRAKSGRNNQVGENADMAVRDSFGLPQHTSKLPLRAWEM